MNISETYFEHSAEFHGDDSMISGTAVYDYSASESYDADHGGRDWMEITNCELIRFELDGLHLTRDQLVKMMGESIIAGDEESTREALQEQFDAGDLLAA